MLDFTFETKIGSQGGLHCEQVKHNTKSNEIVLVSCKKSDLITFQDWDCVNVIIHDTMIIQADKLLSFEIK